MQKKICVSALVTVPANVTTEELMNALRSLGVVEFSTVSSFIEAPAPAEDYPAHVWLYVSSDASEPYQRVRDAGDSQGVDIDDDTMAYLMHHGICTSFYAETPCIDKYGAPHFVADDYAAGAIAHDHGFKVCPGLSVSHTDRGDDGSEDYWLRIALPASSGEVIDTTVPLPVQED